MLLHAMATEDILKHYLPRLEVHSTVQFPFLFLASIFVDPGDWGHSTVRLLHMS